MNEGARSARWIKRFRAVSCFVRHTAKSGVFLRLVQVWSRPNCRSGGKELVSLLNGRHLSCTLRQCAKLELRLNSRVKSQQVPGWTPHFDLTTIPDGVLLRESARRLRARQLRSPRAKVLRQCPKCGEPFGARELRKHLPRCAQPAARGMGLNPRRAVRKVSSLEEQEAENYRYWQSIPVGARLVAVCELTEAAYAIRGAGQNANQGPERTHSRVQRTGR